MKKQDNTEVAIERLREGLNNPKMQDENSQKLLNSMIDMLERGYTPEFLLNLFEHGDEMLEIMECKRQGMSEDETVFYMQYVYPYKQATV